MKFNVNFYIHIYNHPMYIVRNWDHPFKNIHLSYHDGEHYNSIRLKDDFNDDVPIDIPLELINCVEQTTNLESIDNLDNYDLDDNSNSEPTDNYLNDEEEKVEVVNEPENDNKIIFHGTSIKDTKEKKKEEIYTNSIITEEGIIFNEINENKKCHCQSNRKYKKCHSKTDIKGLYNKELNTFYCQLEDFKSKLYNNIKDKSSINTKTKENTPEQSNEVINITKHMEKIFI